MRQFLPSLFAVICIGLTFGACAKQSEQAISAAVATPPPPDKGENKENTATAGTNESSRPSNSPASPSPPSTTAAPLLQQSWSHRQLPILTPELIRSEQRLPESSLTPVKYDGHELRYIGIGQLEYLPNGGYLLAQGSESSATAYQQFFDSYGRPQEIINYPSGMRGDKSSVRQGNILLKTSSCGESFGANGYQSQACGYIQIINLETRALKSFNVTSQVQSATLLSSGFLAYTSPGKLHFFDPKSGKDISAHELKFSRERRFAVTQLSNKVVMVQTDGMAWFFNESGRKLSELPGCELRACEGLKDGRVIYYGKDPNKGTYSFNFFDPLTGKSVRGFDFSLYQYDEFQDLIEVEGGNLLITTTHGTIRLSTRDGNILERHSARGDRTSALNDEANRLSDGRILLISTGGEVMFFGADGRRQHCWELMDIVPRPRRIPNTDTDWTGSWVNRNVWERGGWVNVFVKGVVLLFREDDVRASNRPILPLPGSRVLLGVDRIGDARVSTANVSALEGLMKIDVEQARCR